VAPDLIATIIFFLQKTNDISELRNQLLGLQISPRFPKKPREESGVVVAAMLLLLLLALSAFSDGGRRMQLLKVRRAIKLGLGCKATSSPGPGRRRLSNST
jgi:hypothetical protein